MIRVISGNYKGRLLSKIALKNIRPTQARVRKSIFQILEPLERKNVLDLFAGSGIIGIESLSRGAQKIVAVENNSDACRILKKNLDTICLEDTYKVFCMDAMRFMIKCKEKFDVIFCDPPYEGFNYLDIFYLAKKILNKNGVFCMEMKKIKIDNSKFRVKEFGSTQVIIWRNDE